MGEIIIKRDKNYVPTSEEVKSKALDLLSIRMHSEAEIRQKLKMRNAKSEDIDDAVEYLKECGVIDDYNFAQRYAEELSMKYGKQRIKTELYKKGIDSGIVSEVTEEIEDDREELLSLVEMKLRGDFSKKSTDRAIRYCASRGYSLSNIFSCIREVRGSFSEEDYD